MAVRAAIWNTNAEILEVRRKSSSISQSLFLQFDELFGPGKLEGERHRGDRIDVRTALLAREDALIDLFAEFAVMRDQNCATRTAESFVGCETDHISDADR